MNKKDLVIVVLATFCLTSTLFMILPSRSIERDPWADVSSTNVGEPDGKVNMKDIAYEIAHFNEDVSNMTRDVNVTNWPSKTAITDSNFDWFSGWRTLAPSATYESEILNLSGFREITIFVSTNSTVFCSFGQSLNARSSDGSTWINAPISFEEFYVSYSYTRTINVIGDSANLQVYNWGGSTAQMFCCVYLNTIPNMDTGPSHDLQTVHLNETMYGSSEANVHCGGYSRLSLNLRPSSYKVNGTYDVTIYLYSIIWGNSVQFFSPNDLNITFVVENGHLKWWAYQNQPFIVDTKFEDCQLYFSVSDSHGFPSNGWITFDMDAYLRSE